MASLRQELEEAQASMLSWKNHYLEMVDLNEQKKDQLGTRDRKAAQQEEVIQSIHQVLAARDASEKESRLRAARAEKAAREMALELAAFEERARSFCYIVGGGIVPAALADAPPMAPPAASGERKRPFAPLWAERLRKRLRH